MVIEVSLSTEYTPEWNGNRDDAHPVVVEHKRPTMTLRERLIPKPKITLKLDSEMKASGGESDMEIDTRKIVEEMTIGIKNLSWRDPETGKELQITSAKDLYSDRVPAVFGELADELGVYYQKLLAKRVDTKN